MKVRFGILMMLLAFPAAGFSHDEIFFPKSLTLAELPNTGFVLLNVDSTVATVSFRLLSSNGVVVESSPDLQIPPRGQLARLGSELFPNAKSGGWVWVFTEADGMQALWLSYDSGLTSLDGAEAFGYETLGSDQIIPLTTDDTELNVISLSGLVVPVTVRLFGADREIAPPFTRNISIAGAFQATATEMFPSADLSQARYMRVRTANSPIASTAVVRRFGVPIESAIVNGVNAGARTEMIFSHAVTGVLGNANYTTTIGVANLSASDQVLSMTWTPDGGSPITVTRNIVGNGALRETAANLFQLSSGFSAGWIRVTGTAPLIGFAAYADTVGGALAMVPAGASRRDLFFAHIADGPPQWQTGLALLNAGSVPASVEIYAVNPLGALIGSTTVSIDAGSRTAKVIHDLIPETKGVNSGYVYVRTTNGTSLNGIQLFYTEDMKVLSNVVAGKLVPEVTYVPPSK